MGRPVIPALALSALATACSLVTSEHSPAAIEGQPGAACASDVLVAADFLQLAADDPLACFGARSIEVHGFVSEMAGIPHCPIDYVPGDGWLHPCAGLLPILVADLADADGLGFHLAPGIDPVEAPRGSAVRLIGHFDDPAAASCGVEGGDAAENAEARGACRRAFVVDEIEAAR